MKIHKMFLLCVGMLVLLTNCQKLEDPSTPPLPPNITSSYPYVPVTPGDENPPVPAPVPNPGVSSVFDPLTNGASIGTVRGGVFTPEGYKITTFNGGYIAYSTSISRNIRLEFDAKGYVPRENDGSTGKLVILEIFDSPHNFSWTGGGSWNSQYSLFHLRKRGLSKGQMHNKVDGLELKFGGRGNIEEYKTWDGQSPAGHPVEWNSNTTYHWMVTIQNGSMQVTRNGQVIFSGSASAFNPGGSLNVRIGGVSYGSRTSPRNVTYSNVQIYDL